MVEEVEEAVTCAKEHADRNSTDNNVRERKLHTPGDRYALVDLSGGTYRKFSSGDIGRML